MTEGTPFRETTQPLLRPSQVDAYRREVKHIDDMLKAPPHIANAIQDRSEVARRLRSTNRDLETQLARPYDTPTLDAAMRREAELREQIELGMPTQEEMRRNPPGARDKHMAWERRNKAKLLEWKNIRLRLHAGGHLDQIEYAGDVANFERFRPVGGSQELAMDGAQIPKTRTIMQAPPGAGLPAYMNEEQSATLQAINPDLHAKMALLSNDQRRDVLDLVNRYLELPEASSGAAESDSRVTSPRPTRRPKKAKKKINLSPEERQRRSERMKALSAGLKAKREAAMAAEG